ncbi:MAG: M28 family peptidase [Chloroflexota bacterium]
MSQPATAPLSAVHSLIEAFNVQRALTDLDQLCAKPFAGRRIGTVGHDLAQAWLYQQMIAAGLETQIFQFTAESAVLNLSALPQFEINGLGGIHRQLDYRREFQEHPQSGFQPNIVEGVASRQLTQQGWLIVDHVPPLQTAQAWVESGVAGIVLPQHVGPDGYLSKRVIPRARLPLPVIAVSENLITALVGQTISATMPLESVSVHGGTVLGTLEGTDPTLEPLLVGAHFDGVGDDASGYRIPGAADNAAGVAVILELSRLIGQLGIKPYRSIVFAAFDGEEINATGSYAYAQSLKAAGQKPLVINLDGAAQFHEAVWAELSENADHLMRVLDRTGEWLEIPLVQGSVGSDNRRFAQAGFPTVGLALGGYGGHTPDDTVNRVDPEAMKLAGRLMLATIWQLALQQS